MLSQPGGRKIDFENRFYIEKEMRFKQPACCMHRPSGDATSLFKIVASAEPRHVRAQHDRAATET